MVVPAGMRPLAIVGTTASGKSALAMALARNRGDVELVSVDSMQVYRGMDIGTAKPTVDEQAEIVHHVIDLVDPWEPFEVHSFQAAVATALADISARGRRAVLVGGTGMYLRAVVDGFEIPGRFPDVAASLAEVPETEEETRRLHARLHDLDPTAAGRMEPTNRRRIVRALEVCVGSGRPFSSFGPGFDAHPPSPVHMVGTWLSRAVVAERIERRYQQQLADGFVDEVRALMVGPGEGVLPDGAPAVSHTAAQALGYRELIAHLDAAALGAEEPTLDQAVAEAVVRTRQFARRQRVWFRRDPRVVWHGADRDPMVALAGLEVEAHALWGPPSPRGR